MISRPSLWPDIRSQYVVTSQLCENTYFLKASQVAPIAANVGQMKLVQRSPHSMVESEEGMDPEPLNLSLIALREKEYEIASLHFRSSPEGSTRLGS